MKQVVTAALACLLLAGLPGCGGLGKTGGAPGEYRVYYSALGDRAASAAVGYEMREVPKEGEPVAGLLRALFQGPESQALSSPFPEGARLLSWTMMEDGCLCLDLSEQYGSLTGVDLTIADACLTLTLCQVEGVDTVYVTVEGDEIPYRPIQQLKEEDLLCAIGQSGGRPSQAPAPGT